MWLYERIQNGKGKRMNKFDQNKTVLINKHNSKSVFYADRKK